MKASRSSRSNAHHLGVCIPGCHPVNRKLQLYRLIASSTTIPRQTAAHHQLQSSSRAWSLGQCCAYLYASPQILSHVGVVASVPRAF